MFNPQKIKIMVQIIDVIKQLEVVIPSMMAAELLLTSTIKGIFNIKSDLVNTILSWVLSLGTAFLFVLCNGLDFGLGGWNYAVAAVGGLIVAICTNKIYTWEKVKALLDAITALFSGNKTYVYRLRKEEELLTKNIEKASTFLSSPKASIHESSSPAKGKSIHLLREQVEIMRQYKDRVSQRIALEKEE